MKLYWTPQQISELNGLSGTERNRIWRKAYLAAYRHWQTWIAVAGVFASAVLSRLIGSALGFENLGMLIGIGITLQIHQMVIIHLLRPIMPGVGS